MKWKFYIDDVQVHEPSNWNEIATKVGRSVQYWGLQIEASLSEVTFQQVVSRTVPNGYDVLKDKFDALGVNAKAAFRIDKWNEDLGIYEVSNRFVFDFTEYKEVYDREFGVAVKIALINDELWKRLNARGGDKLNVGDIVAVEGETVLTVDSDDVLFRALPLKLDSTKSTGYDPTMDGVTIDTYLKWRMIADTRTSLSQMNDLEWIIPLTNVKTNIDWVNDTVFNKIKRSLPNTFQRTALLFNFPPILPIETDSHYAFEPFNILMSETPKDFNIILDFDIDLQAQYSTPGPPANWFIYLVEADYDGVGISNLDRIETYTKSIALGGSTENFNGSFNFVKKANKIYYLSLAGDNNTFTQISANWDNITETFTPVDLGFIKADVSISTQDIEPESVHKAYSLRNCMTSMLRQITGRDDVLDSPLFSDVSEPDSFCLITEPTPFSGEIGEDIVVIDTFSLSGNYGGEIDISVTRPFSSNLFLNIKNTDTNEVVFSIQTPVSPLTKYFIDILPFGNYEIYLFIPDVTPLNRIITNIRSLCFYEEVEATTFDRIFLTNGKFLRNATTIEGDEPKLTLTYRDLWQTINALYGLGKDIRNDKFYVDYKSEMFGNDEFQISPIKVELSVDNSLMFTSTKVGNKRISYEFQNGTEEFNTELEFSQELSAKDNVFDLVTKYNTDYLGVELARRLSFSKTATEDTKYDDKVFLVFCDLVGTWRTSQYFDISNYPVDVAYNVEFSPKRMLLRNSDVLKACLWKLPDSKVRFKEIENLSTFISGGITENADLYYSELNENFYIPIILDLEVGEKDLETALKNRNSIFIFTFKGVEYKGYLWEADVKNGIGNIKLLMKNEE
jgi:hypothetical protein